MVICITLPRCFLLLGFDMIMQSETAPLAGVRLPSITKICNLNDNQSRV